MNSNYYEKLLVSEKTNIRKHCKYSTLYRPADLTVSKRPGTSSRIEIHFAVFNRLFLLFCFIKLVEIW